MAQHRTIKGLVLVALAPLLFSVASGGCGGKLAETSPDAAPTPTLAPAPAPSGGAADAAPDVLSATDTCTPRGGVCLPAGASAPPNRRQASPKEAACLGGDVCWLLLGEPLPTRCVVDPDCNPSPTISALYGACFFGICVCNAGFHVQPSGKCDKPPPAPCPDQGGTCFQQPPKCPAGSLEGTAPLNVTCGDLIAAVCCTPDVACRGPVKTAGGASVAVDFACCAPNDALLPPVCVNGWQTCPEGSAPFAKPGGCG